MGFIEADEAVENLAYEFMRGTATPNDCYRIFDKHGEAINLALRKAADFQRKLEQPK